LRGVNDDVATLEALMRAFVENRVKPYYLHHPDMAPGTGHFRLGLAEAQTLVKALRGRVSGLCQPVHVLDIPGGHGKVPVGLPLAAPPDAPGQPWLIEDRHGVRHVYHELVAYREDDGAPG
jgi:lysine 2,3-aminomutase